MLEVRYMLKYTYKRIVLDHKCIKSEDFLELAKFKDTSFSRLRKLGLEDTILSTLSRKGKTLKMDVRNYLIERDRGISMTRQGYTKQRLNLNPEAFQFLNSKHVEHIYKYEDELETKKGYLVFAVDGSDILLPTTQTTLATYGNTSRKGVKEVAQGSLSCIYDVFNKINLQACFNRNKYSERQSLKDGFHEINKLIKSKDIVVIMDRNYFSLEMLYYFMYILKKNFIFRLRDKDLTIEKNQMTGNDEMIEIILDRSRINMYRKTEIYSKFEEIKSMKARMVKYKLSTGEMEYLLTDLTAEEFDTDEIGELYFGRWRIETSYDLLKNNLQLENFTGKLPLLIEQDIYATLYLSNIVQDCIWEAEFKNKLEDKYRNYKYEMKINQNMTIGIIKEELIKVILEDDEEKKENRYLKMIEEIRKNIIPIRPGRSNQRNKNPKSQKYPMNKKKSF